MNTLLTSTTTTTAKKKQAQTGNAISIPQSPLTAQTMSLQAVSYPTVSSESLSEQNLKEKEERGPSPHRAVTPAIPFPLVTIPLASDVEV